MDIIKKYVKGKINETVESENIILEVDQLSRFCYKSELVSKLAEKLNQLINSECSNLYLGALKDRNIFFVEEIVDKGYVVVQVEANGRYKFYYKEKNKDGYKFSDRLTDAFIFETRKEAEDAQRTNEELYASYDLESLIVFERFYTKYGIDLSDYDEAYGVKYTLKRNGKSGLCFCRDVSGTVPDVFDSVREAIAHRDENIMKFSGALWEVIDLKKIDEIPEYK